MKKFCSLIVSAIFLIGTYSFAAAAGTSAQVGANAVKNAKSQAKEKQIEVVQEGVDALVLTHKVLDDLDKKNQDAAIKDIEKAIGKLEVILAGKQVPAMLPIDSSIMAVEFTGNLQSIEKTTKRVIKLLNDSHVQAARRLLDTLQSEIDVVTINLPLVSYPQALKLAAKYLHEKKPEDAKDVLEMALGTLVRNEVIIPIPLLKAEALVGEAKKIAAKDKKQALKHLESATNELKIAEALGYTSSSDTTYKNLDDSIKSIEKEIKGKNKAEKLFDDLKAKLREFKEKAIKIMNKKGSE